jgi:hypothetical protein
MRYLMGIFTDCSVKACIFGKTIRPTRRLEGENGRPPPAAGGSLALPAKASQPLKVNGTDAGYNHQQQ